MPTIAADPEQELKVFISYSRKDMSFADRLDASLKAQAIEPLIDRTKIVAFEDWWKRIQSLIGQADTVIFVLSPESVSSDICKKEVAFAASLNKRFAPIVLRRVENEAVPAELGRLNFIFFDDEARYEEGIASLLDALETDVAWIRRHTEFGQNARAWADATRPSGLLLRSPLLEEAERWIAARPRGAPAPTADTQTFVTESRRAAMRRRNILTGSLAAGLSVALGFAGLAYWQSLVAKHNETIALNNEAQAIASGRLAEEQRKLAELRRQEAEEQRRVAEENEAIAGKERNRAVEALKKSEALRQFFLTRSLVASGRTEKAQLVAIELFERLNLVMGSIDKPTLNQLYYDAFSGPLLQLEKPSTITKAIITAPPLREASARFAKRSNNCEAASCEKLSISHPSLGVIEFNCDQLDLCHETAFSGEGLKRVVPHPFLPIALIEIYAYGDWRLLDFSRKSISKNIFPQRLVCRDECLRETFEACFISRDAIFWQWRQTGSMIVTNLDGYTIGELAGDVSLTGPVECLPGDTAKIRRQPKPYYVVRAGSFVRRFTPLDKRDVEVLQREGLVSGTAQSIIRTFIGVDGLLKGSAPGGEAGLVFKFIARSDDKYFGLIPTPAD